MGSGCDNYKRRAIVPFQGDQLELELNLYRPILQNQARSPSPKATLVPLPLPGTPIRTASGTAIVTRVQQIGTEMIIFADYGSGIEHPHLLESLIGEDAPERKPRKRKTKSRAAHQSWKHNPLREAHAACQTQFYRRIPYGL